MGKVGMSLFRNSKKEKRSIEADNASCEAFEKTVENVCMMNL